MAGLGACSQQRPAAGGKLLISLEARIIAVPEAQYAGIAAQVAGLPPDVRARPRAVAWRGDNFSLAQLLRTVQSSGETLTVTAPRATIADHGTATIRLVGQRNYVSTTRTPPPMPPPLDTHSTATCTASILSHDRVEVAVTFTVTPYVPHGIAACRGIASGGGDAAVRARGGALSGPGPARGRRRRPWRTSAAW
jgi:hypothetical protein